MLHRGPARSTQFGPTLTVLRPCFRLRVQYLGGPRPAQPRVQGPQGGARAGALAGSGAGHSGHPSADGAGDDRNAAHARALSAEKVRDSPFGEFGMAFICSVVARVFDLPTFLLISRI